MAWLLVVHCQLILCDGHGQNAVSNIAQRLFAFNQTNAILFGFTFWHLEESAGRFTAVTAGEGLHKISWLNVRVSDWQRIFTCGARATAWLNGHLFRHRIVGHFIARQTYRAFNIIQPRIFRIFKHHDVATFRMTRFDQRFLVDRIFDAIGKLFNQNEITDQQRWHHRS